MTRLQKKCLITVAGFHLMIVVVVVCSGFLRPTPKEDNTTVLDLIPDIGDQTAGVPNPQTPPPTPPQPQAQPPIPAPAPQVQPPTPTPPTPEPPKPQTLIERIEKTFTPDPTPTEKVPDEQPKPKPQKRQIDVNLTPVVHTVSKTTDTSATDAQEAKREAEQRQKAIDRVARTLSKNLSSATTEAKLVGHSSASTASYRDAITSVYYHAWAPPQNMSVDSAMVGFSVVVSRDGSVISSTIKTSSGDPDVDRAVQQMLDRVTFIAPFPDSMQDDQHTFHINFNATKTSIQ